MRKINSISQFHVVANVLLPFKKEWHFKISNKINSPLDRQAPYPTNCTSKTHGKPGKRLRILILVLGN